MSDLTVQQKEQLTIGLSPKLSERKELINSYNDVIKLEITEENLPKFKALRLQLVKNRTAITNWHKNEKAFYLAGGRFIDAIKNKEIAVNKEMEAKLTEGEQYFARLEAERLEKIRAERWDKLSKFVEVEPAGLSTMENYMFEALLLGAETTYKQKIEAEKKAESERLEVERKKILHQQRKEELLPYLDYVPEQAKIEDLGSLTDEEFNNRLEFVKSEKEQHEKEIEAQRLENERLKKANELKEKRTKELQPYIVFIRDYNGLISKPESQYQKELKDIKKGAEEHWEFERKEQLRKQRELELQQEENKRLQAELKAKKEAELKEAKRLEELAKAPIKEQLHAWVNSFTFDSCPVENETTKNITNKFNGFLTWAKSEIEKI